MLILITILIHISLRFSTINKIAGSYNMFEEYTSLENISTSACPSLFGFSVELFQCTNQRPPSTKKRYEPFRLPITYVNPAAIHTLSPVVEADLELSGFASLDSYPSLEGEELNSSSGKAEPMYFYLFQPEHQYAKDMIHEWKKSYTTDIEFLKDSQAVITDMVKYEYKMTTEGGRGPDGDYVFDSSKCDIITNIWDSVKEDDGFLERYSFVEWDFLKSFNSSESFLQILSIMNLSSPIMSLLIPVLLLVFPFLILMVQRIPITFEIYLSTLREIAKNHFIGKAIFNIQNITMERAAYLLMMVGLYFFQIYQNIMICRRFYRNMERINGHLCELRQYIAYSANSMEMFARLNKDKESYREFCEVTYAHSLRLRQFGEILAPIRPFSYTLSKVWEFGYLLKSVYEFYSNPEYDASIRYSIGFEGYINNMRGIFRNVEGGHIAMSKYLDSNEYDVSGEGLTEGFGRHGLTIDAQYYPPTIRETPVKNKCNLSKNAIITGPNASGKTTFLKTTTLNILFSQQVGCGFYRSCSIRPYTHIHSYLNIPDTSGRDSLFQAESRRCKEIIDIILANQGSGHRHYCIFDELYSGTNPTEATKSAYAFLKYLGNFQNVDFILTTHYLSVCKRFRKSAVIQNYQMDALVDEDTGKITYTYKIRRGISKIQGAVKILEEMDYPREILDTIQNYTNI